MRSLEFVAEKWSQKYKSSINCANPQGFSQKAHCAGKNKHNESIGVAEKLGDNRPTLGNKRDQGRIIRKWRSARGLDEQGVAEGMAQDEAEEYSGWRAELVNQINYNTFEVKMTNTRSKESANFVVRPVDMMSIGPTLAIETMDVHDLQTGQTESWTKDDPLPDGGIVYAISGMFYDNKQLQKKLWNIVDTHNTKGQDMMPGLDQRRSIGQEVDADAYIDSQEKTQDAMAKMKQGMAEGLDDPWGDQGNFAGATPVNIGGETVKRLGVGDTVTYFGRRAKIIGMSKTGNTSRITIANNMGGITQDVLTSDLKRTGVAEASRGKYHANTTGFARGARDDERHDLDQERTQIEKSGTWYIRLNGKLIKDKQGKPYSFRGKAAANKAAITMQAKLFNQGKEFVLTTNPNDPQPGVAEQKKNSKKDNELAEAVTDNYLYHATQPGGMMRILRTGVIKAGDRSQAATKAKTQYPTISTTRSKQYAESEDFVDFLNLTKEGNSVIIVLDRPKIANHYKMFSTSQGTQTVGDEYEEVIVAPAGSMPIQGTIKGFYFNPRRTQEIEEFKDVPWFQELLNSPYYMGPKQSVAEAFDQPYEILRWEQGDFGDVDAIARLDDGTFLSIMFNKGVSKDSKEEAWSVEFYRNNSQEVTGEGDAQRVFATVLSAIQTFIEKYKPNRITFSASKEVEPGQNAQSRARLYDSLVQRYAKALGFRAFRADTGNKVIYELNRIQPVAKSVMETINLDILNKRFRHKQVIGDYTYTASVEMFMGEPLLNIKAYDRDREIGHILFEIIVRSPGGKRKPSEDYLESGGTEVDPAYRNKGVASTMYAYAKMLGNDIRASYNQTSQGQAMWAAWEKAGDAKHLAAEGREKFNTDLMKPGFRWSEEINGITYLVRTQWDNMPEVVAKVNNREVGRATFIDHHTRSGLESVSTYVSPKWQGHGIAKNMYAVVRMLGANIQPSATQTAMGKNMWDKWKQAGDTKHLTSMNAKPDPQG